MKKKTYALIAMIMASVLIMQTAVLASGMEMLKDDAKSIIPEGFNIDGNMESFRYVEDRQIVNDEIYDNEPTLVLGIDNKSGVVDPYIDTDKNDTTVSTISNGESVLLETDDPEEDNRDEEISSTTSDSTGSYAWKLDDYDYWISDDTKEISLISYIGTSKDIYIPNNTVLDGQTYKIGLSAHLQFPKHIKNVDLSALVLDSFEADYLFNDCSNLISVKMPQGFLSCNPMNMFNRCEKLKYVYFGELYIDKSFSESDRGIHGYGLSNMFEGCSSLEKVYGVIDAGNLNLTSMFEGCSSLKKLPNFTNVNDSNMKNMFAGCSSLTEADLSDWNMKNENGTHYCERMFYDCSNLKTVKFGLIGERCDMDGMFNGCSKLETVEFDKKVLIENMSGMFFGCSALKTIDLSNVGLVGGRYFGNFLAFEENNNTLMEIKTPKEIYENYGSYSYNSSFKLPKYFGYYRASNSWEYYPVLEYCPLGVTLKRIVNVESVDLNKKEVNLLSGEEDQLSAIIAPDNADFIKKGKIRWSSLDEKIVTVDKNGKIKAVEKGETEVKCTVKYDCYPAKCNVESQETYTLSGWKSDDIVFEASCKVKVTKPVSVKSISISPELKIINPGDTFLISTNVLPEDATNKTVKWSSSDDSIASVDANGLVAGNAVGKATITATTEDGGYTATCEVTVEPVFVTSLSLNKKSASLEVDGTETLTVTVTPENATNKGVVWTSSDPSIVSVDTSGLITGMSVGKATVTATAADDSGASDTCEVTVTPILVKRVTLSTNNVYMEVGQAIDLEATVLPENAANKTLKWQSNNESVVTVDNKGTVRSISEGNAVITVTSTDGSDNKDTCSITVVDKLIKVENISINPKSQRINIGDTFTLSVSIMPENANDKNITWTTSDADVATVSDAGVVIGKSIGNAVIKAETSNGKTAICNVTVTDTIYLVPLQRINIKTVIFPDITETISRYTVDNKKIALISKDMLKAKKSGKVTVSAEKKEGNTYTVIATREIFVLSRPKLKFTSPFTYIGQTKNANDYFTTEDTKLIGVTYWESSKSNVVEVIDAENGILKANGNGSAKITAYFGKKGEKGTVKLTTSISVKVPAFAKKEYKVMTGANAIISMKNVSKTQNIEWRTDNETIAIASAQINKKGDLTGKGVVTGLSYGDCTLTAVIDGKEYNCIIHVTAPEISKKNMTVRAGRTSTISLKKTKIKKADVEWFSSDESIAAVGVNGKVKGISKGQAIIYTETGGVRNECVVIVK